MDPDSLFVEFYECAVSYAKGHLDPISGKHQVLNALRVCISNIIPMIGGSQHFAALETVKNVFQIFSTKPKFSNLLYERDGFMLLDWVGRNLLPVLTALVERYEVVEAMILMSELSNQIYEASNHTFKMEFDISGLAERLILPSHSVGIGVSSNASNLFEILALTSKDVVLSEIATRASDISAFSLLWKLLIHDSDIAFKTFLNRVSKKSPQSHQLLELALEALTDTIRQREIQITPGSEEKMISFLKFCDVRIPSTKVHGVRLLDTEDIPDNILDRLRTLFDVSSALLDLNPNSPDILAFHLRYAIAEAVDFACELAFKLNPPIIADTLFPFCLNELQNAPQDTTDPDSIAAITSTIDLALNAIEGLYGSELARQTAADLVEIKLNYQKASALSPELGRLAFQCIDYSIRFEAGTRDTQRFPFLAAAILLTHVPESAQWLLDAFTRHQALKDRRLVEYITIVALGVLKDIEDPLSAVAEMSGARSFLITALFSCASKSFTAVSLMLRILRRCGDDRGKFLKAHESCFIFGAQQMKILITMQSESFSVIESVLEYSNYFLMTGGLNNDCIAAVFDLLVTCLHIVGTSKIPEIRGLHGIVDAAFKLSVDHLEILLPSQLDILSQVMPFLGENSAISLACMVPHLFLSDSRLEVCLSALVALQNRPDLVALHSDEIIPAINRISEVQPHDPLFIAKYDTLVAAAPVLGILAAQLKDLDTLKSAVILLIDGCEQSAKSDTRNFAAPIFLDALGMIAKDGDPILIDAFLKSITGKIRNDPIRAKLEFFSREWKNFSTVANKPQSQKAQSQQVTSDVLNGLIMDVMKRFHEKDFMGSLRLAAQVKRRYPQEYHDMGVERTVKSQIFPQIAQKILPNVSAGPPGILTNLVFSDQDLDNYDIFMSYLRELLLLFPQESAQLLHAQKRATDMNSAIIQRYLLKNDPSGANEFLKKHRIHSPQLRIAIDNYSASKEHRESLSRQIVHRLSTPTAPVESSLPPIYHFSQESLVPPPKYEEDIKASTRYDIELFNLPSVPHSVPKIENVTPESICVEMK